MTQDKINSLIIDEELLFFIQNYSSINQKFVKENIDEVDLSDNTYEPNKKMEFLQRINKKILILIIIISNLLKYFLKILFLLFFI